MMKYTLSLWGWRLWSAFQEVAYHMLPGRWFGRIARKGKRIRALCLSNWIILWGVKAFRFGQTQWRISREGCAFDEAMFDQDLEEYTRDRRAEAEKARTTPFEMPEMPPVSPRHFPKIERFERKWHQDLIDNVDKDIAVETARMDRIRHFRPGDWRLLVTRLWRMSSTGFFDRMLYRQASRGLGRKIKLTVSRESYTLELDVTGEHIDCRMTFDGEAEPLPSLSKLRKVLDEDEWW